MKMILRTTHTSPFSRKVKIAAIILGLAEHLEKEMADPWSAQDHLRGQNPLGKIPCLILEDGTAIYDSPVILEYLDMIAEKPCLFPKAPAERIEVLRLQALGDGMMDAGLLMVYERQRRPAQYCYEEWIAHQRGKIERALSWLVANLPDPHQVNAGTISIACALGYMDWRKQVDWRKDFPALIAWLESFSAQVPAFLATKAEH